MCVPMNACSYSVGMSTSDINGDCGIVVPKNAAASSVQGIGPYLSRACLEYKQHSAYPDTPPLLQSHNASYTMLNFEDNHFEESVNVLSISSCVWRDSCTQQVHIHMF